MTDEREEALRLWAEAGFTGFIAHEDRVIKFYRLARAQPAQDGPRKLGDLPFIPEELARMARCAAQSLPLLYLCPAGCGCTWRDNHDGTMSLGLYQRSCEVCETLPLGKLVALYFSPPENVRRTALEEAAKLVDLIGIDWRDAGFHSKHYAAQYLRDQLRDLSAAPKPSGGKP